MPLLGGSPRKLVVPQGAQAAHIQRRGKAGGKKLIWMALGALSVPGALRAASFHPHSGITERDHNVHLQRRRRRLRGSVTSYFQLLSGKSGIQVHQPTPKPEGSRTRPHGPRVEDCVLDWTG